MNYSQNNGFGSPSGRNNSGAVRQGSFFRSNPVMNRLTKVDEKGASNSASYTGIMIKTAYFLLMTAVGIAIYIALERMAFAGSQIVEFNVYKFHAAVPIGAIITVGISAVVAIIFQLIAAFAPGTIPFTGTIYCAAQGMIISFVVFSVLGEYSYLGAIALVITFLIVMIMAILYCTGKVRMTKKFTLVLLTLVFGMLGVSLVTFIGMLIPFTRPMFQTILSNPVISMGMTLLSIILATLFLISDFAMIQSVVENKMPVKYEWMASFGLAFTVLWLYVKILDILIQIVGNNKN